MSSYSSWFKAKYNRTIHSVSINVPYEFRCEHCWQHSGMLESEFRGAAARNKNRKKIKKSEWEAMHQEAVESLHRSLAAAQSDAQNQKYEFRDKCPHCGKHQSWTLKAMADLHVLHGFFGFCAGMFLGVSAMFVPDILTFWGYEVEFSFGVVPLSILFFTLAGAVSGRIGLRIRKKQAANVDKKEIPRIHWPEPELVNFTTEKYKKE